MTCFDNRFKKQKYRHHDKSEHFPASYFFNQFVFSKGINATKFFFLTSLRLMVLFIHINDLYIHQAQFRTGLPSPALPRPPSPIPYWPTKPSLVLAHQDQFRIGPTSQSCTGPPSPIPYWPNKPSPVLAHQA